MEILPSSTNQNLQEDPPKQPQVVPLESLITPRNSEIFRYSNSENARRAAQRARAVNQGMWEELFNQGIRIFGGAALQFMAAGASIPHWPDMAAQTGFAAVNTVANKTLDIFSPGSKRENIVWKPFLELEGSPFEYFTNLNQQLREAYPIYENPDNGIFGGESISNFVADVSSSVLGYGAVGAGFKLAGMGARAGISTLAPRTAPFLYNSVGLQTAERINAALLMTHSESLGSYMNVHESVYKMAKEQNLSDSEAQALASNEALKSYIINTVINTSLNFVVLDDIFKINTPATRFVKRLAKETDEAYAARLQQLDIKPLSPFRRLLPYATGAIEEGTEEVVNVVAEAIGVQSAENKLGLEDKNLGETIRNAVFSNEGAYAALAGAIGGIGQRAITRHLPLNRYTIYKYDILPGLKEGTKKLTASKIERYERVRSEMVLKDHLVKQMDNIVTLRKELKALKTQYNDLENSDSKNQLEEQLIQKENELFNVMIEGSVALGIHENLGRTFEIIRDLNQQEAEEEGYDTNIESPFYYKKMAEEKLESLKQAESFWKRLNKSVLFSDEELKEQLPNKLLLLKIRSNQLKARLNKARPFIETQITEEQSTLDKVNEDLKNTESELQALEEYEKNLLSKSTKEQGREKTKIMKANNEEANRIDEQIKEIKDRMENLETETSQLINELDESNADNDTKQENRKALNESKEKKQIVLEKQIEQLEAKKQDLFKENKKLFRTTLAKENQKQIASKQGEKEIISSVAQLIKQRIENALFSLEELKNRSKEIDKNVDEFIKTLQSKREEVRKKIIDTYNSIFEDPTEKQQQVVSPPVAKPVIPSAPIETPVAAEEKVERKGEREVQELIDGDEGDETESDISEFQSDLEKELDKIIEIINNKSEKITKDKIINVFKTRIYDKFIKDKKIEIDDRILDKINFYLNYADMTYDDFLESLKPKSIVANSDSDPTEVPRNAHGLDTLTLPKDISVLQQQVDKQSQEQVDSRIGNKESLVHTMDFEKKDRTKENPLIVSIKKFLNLGASFRYLMPKYESSRKFYAVLNREYYDYEKGKNPDKVYNEENLPIDIYYSNEKEGINEPVLLFHLPIYNIEKEKKSNNVARLLAFRKNLFGSLNPESEKSTDEPIPVNIEVIKKLTHHTRLMKKPLSFSELNETTDLDLEATIEYLFKNGDLQLTYISTASKMPVINEKNVLISDTNILNVGEGIDNLGQVFLLAREAQSGVFKRVPLFRPILGETKNLFEYVKNAFTILRNNSDKDIQKQMIDFLESILYNNVLFKNIDDQEIFNGGTITQMNNFLKTLDPIRDNSVFVSFTKYGGIRLIEIRGNKVSKIISSFGNNELYANPGDVEVIDFYDSNKQITQKALDALSNVRPAYKATYSGKKISVPLNLNNIEERNYNSFMIFEAFKIYFLPNFIKKDPTNLFEDGPEHRLMVFFENLMYVVDYNTDEQTRLVPNPPVTKIAEKRVIAPSVAPAPPIPPVAPVPVTSASESNSKKREIMELQQRVLNMILNTSATLHISQNKSRLLEQLRDSFKGSDIILLSIEEAYFDRNGFDVQELSYELTSDPVRFYEFVIQHKGNVYSFVISANMQIIDKKLALSKYTFTEIEKYAIFLARKGGKGLLVSRPAIGIIRPDRETDEEKNAREEAEKQERKKRYEKERIEKERIEKEKRKAQAEAKTVIINSPDISSPDNSPKAEADNSSQYTTRVTRPVPKINLDDIENDGEKFTGRIDGPDSGFDAETCIL